MAKIIKNPVQKIKHINLTDLVLWSENPREPMNKESSVEVIIKQALNDKRKKWELKKLYKKMGGANAYYDTSELPTVVIEDEKYIVYDGNRRVALIRYLQDPEKFKKIENPFKGIPLHLRKLKKIPCNVCDRDTALENIRRKHVDSSSWDALERDIFLHKYMGEDKSNLLLLDEVTNLVTENDGLNKRFFRDEVLKNEHLVNIGIKFEGEELESIYDDSDTKMLLSTLADAIISKAITTRKRLDKGNLVKVLIELNPKLKNKIKSISASKVKPKASGNIKIGYIEPSPPKKSRPRLFPNPLSLRDDSLLHSIYHDITKIDLLYHSNTETSDDFPRILRFALRLLVEVASDEKDIENAEGSSVPKKTRLLTKYAEENFAAAKKDLSDKEETFLHAQQVKEDLIVGLLERSGHNHEECSSYEQARAMSIIIGAMLEKDYGTKKS